MHQDNHEASGCDQSDADDVQAHGQPAHRAAEQVKRGLVVIQQLLVPETNTAKVSRLHEPDVPQVSDVLKLLFHYQDLGWEDSSLTKFQTKT